MFIFRICIAFLFGVSLGIAQEIPNSADPGSSDPDSSDQGQLKEVVISVAKWKQDKDKIPQQIVGIDAADIAQQMPPTAADLLGASGQVFVQKSQLGGGSPMIRGFSTNRLLLAVDGVRMNNAIFRGGNLQNVISIDPFAIERTSVILGPGSVVYGSDAVGGVMNFYTLTPRFSKSQHWNPTVNASVRYATASQEKTAHIDVHFGHRRWALLSSISYTDFEDLKMGRHGPEDYLRPEYVQSSGLDDGVIPNNDPRIQVETGYTQINLMQKIRFKPNVHWNLEAAARYSTTSDYPRYDRLIRYREGQLRSAEWFYGPQRWLMTDFQATRQGQGGLYDQMKATLAYQRFEESRNDRDFGEIVRFKNSEQVDAYSLNFDFEKRLRSHGALYYGLEYVQNRVWSTGHTLDLVTNESQEAPSRYPDGALWQSLAGYANLQYNLGPKLSVQSGLRYNHILLDAEFDRTFFDFPFQEASLSTGALTGSFGLSWVVNPVLQWKLNLSTAFRAPNVDDIGKIFDSEPGAVVVPNPDLKPEYAYSGEAALVLKPMPAVTLDLATYYTLLDDALVRGDFSLNGQGTILYAGEPSRVQAIQNAAQTRIHGLEAGLEVLFGKKWSLRGQYSITGGRDQGTIRDGLNSQTAVPSRHVAPQFGMARLQYQHVRWTFAAKIAYQGGLSHEQLAPSEQAKGYLYAADVQGRPYVPSWYTLNVMGRYQWSAHWTLTASFENMTNQRYRTYSSGIAASGQNLIVALHYGF